MIGDQLRCKVMDVHSAEGNGRMSRGVDLGKSLQQFRRSYTKRSSDPRDIHQTYVPLTSLNRADIVPVEATKLS